LFDYQNNYVSLKLVDIAPKLLAAFFFMLERLLK